MSADKSERQTIERKASAVGASIVVVWSGSTRMICFGVMLLEVVLRTCICGV